MRKIFILFLASFFVLSVNGNSFSASRDSTSLMNERLLSTKIEASSPIPVGTIVTWPSDKNPTGWSDNPKLSDWLECDGKKIPDNFKELIAIVGEYTPDYTGLFLRGKGGKSGKLGELQENATHIAKDKGNKITLQGISRGDYALEDNSSYHDAGYSESGGKQVVKFFKSLTPAEDSEWYRYGFQTSGSGIGSGGSLSLPFSLESPAGETRPDNKAVRYLIKAK